MRTALQTIGWTVEVFWSDGDPAKGEFSNFAVTVTLDSLADWPAACEAFIPKLQELSVLGEQPLLVPVVNDRSVLRLTVRVGSRVWAGGDFGEFEHLLPEQLDQCLTSPFIAASSALDVYSALSALRRDGELHHDVRQLLDRTLLYSTLLYSTTTTRPPRFGPSVKTLWSPRSPSGWKRSMGRWRRNGTAKLQLALSPQV